MQITKFVHSCLLVETPDRAALFDPGVMSEEALGTVTFDRLDDIFITHGHGDHCSLPAIERLLAQFPEVRITAPDEVVKSLAEAGIKASSSAPDGVVFFDSPHAPVEPLAPQPQEFGYHYLDQLSHPGDCHTFSETKAILALPITAPWGSSLTALKLALALKPQHVVPIHDWHWRDEAREQSYERFKGILAEQGITFHKLETGQPETIDA